MIKIYIVFYQRCRLFTVRCHATGKLSGSTTFACGYFLFSPAAKLHRPMPRSLSSFPALICFPTNKETRSAKINLPPSHLPGFYSCPRPLPAGWKKRLFSVQCVEKMINKRSHWVNGIVWTFIWGKIHIRLWQPVDRDRILTKHNPYFWSDTGVTLRPLCPGRTSRYRSPRCECTGWDDAARCRRNGSDWDSPPSGALHRRHHHALPRRGFSAASVVAGPWPLPSGEWRSPGDSWNDSCRLRFCRRLSSDSPSTQGKLQLSKALNKTPLQQNPPGFVKFCSEKKSVIKRWHQQISVARRGHVSYFEPTSQPLIIFRSHACMHRGVQMIKVQWRTRMDVI